MHDRTPSAPQDRPPRNRAPPVYRTVHDPDGPATLSATVVHALADCLDVDVTDGRIALYDSVDPDALDDLFRPRHDGTPRTGSSLSFVVGDYDVTVRSDGEILIEPPARR